VIGLAGHAVWHRRQHRRQEARPCGGAARRRPT
jgi:hypothetical protein